MNEPYEYLESTKTKVYQTIDMFEERGLDKNKFCVMPFVNIILGPGGEVGMCRHKGSNHSFGNIKNQTIQEIWTSPEVQEWREGHLNGNALVCKTELIDRKCNLCPELNSLLPHGEISNTVNPKVFRLTANLNGKCNLQCVFCDVWKEPNGFYNDENFWIPAREMFFKDIKEVDLLSGEPFIQADTYRLIREVFSVNPDCVWTFTTNMHWKLTDEVKLQLDNIKIKNMIVSIDSLEKEVYAKLRTPGNLDFVLKNLDTMLEYQKERLEHGKSALNFRINFLIQIDNWKEVKSMINFCFEKEIVPFISFLYIPDEFSLLTFELSKKIEVLDFYFETLTREELLLTQRVLKPLIRSLDKLNYTYYMNVFHEKILS